MAFECYYPHVPCPKGEDPERYLVAYKRYDGYVFQKANGVRVLETTTSWRIKKKIEKLIADGYTICWVMGTKSPVS